MIDANKKPITLHLSRDAFWFLQGAIRNFLETHPTGLLIDEIVKELELEQEKPKGNGGINCIRNPRIKCHQKAITPSPDYAEQPSCLLGMECKEKGVMAKKQYKG